jgi:hypothetical protein
MPKRANTIHQKILAALIEGAPKFPLARNVSEDNVNRAAKRWFS